MKRSKKQKFNLLRAFLIFLAVSGILIMYYLTTLHFKVEDNAFCNLGEGLSCDIVNKSLYSEVLGIPMSVLGLGYFIFLLLVLVFKYKEKVLNKTLLLSIAFFGPSLYLSYIEFFVIENICVFCELSKIIILTIIISLIFTQKKKPKKEFFIGAIILALLFAGFTYLLQNRSIPKKEYNSFAQCLTENGYLMYGSVTCSFCARQRALFGNSFEYITEIECDPRNPNDEAERCISKEVERTPTWFIEDKNGNTIKRFEAGVISLEDLSKLSNCPLLEE
jgi:uncharacterized membrane protein